MKLISNARVPDGLLATMTLLSEKPRHGVASWESAPQSGIDRRNSTALLGLQIAWSEIASDPVDVPINQNCSVLDPNCKMPGPVIKYVTFLGCEFNIAVADVADAAPASYGALAAGAVGVKQMHTFLTATPKVIRRVGLREGVPGIGEMAALYDVTMMNLEAVKANKACTALVYGH